MISFSFDELAELMTTPVLRTSIAESNISDFQVLWDSLCPHFELRHKDTDNSQEDKIVHCKMDIL